MTITRLSLAHFRSYASARIDPGPGLNILTGENGAGKTNILEAISVLAPGRGLRGAALAEMAQGAGPGGFAVSATLDGTVIGAGIEAASPGRRIVRINGAPASATALSEWLSVVWLTPAMDRLFTEGAGERRRFLDRLVLALDPSHGGHSARYEAAMRQRNRLLADPGRADPAWLSALEAQMDEHGTAIAVARAQLVSLLSEALEGAPDPGFPGALLSIAEEALPCALAEALARSRSRDAAAGRTLHGPHRADLVVVHRQKQQPAARCSTGEQKALLLGLVLAHARLVESRSGRRPLILLDEVAAHLDPGRRASLFARLCADGGQVWMTGTEPALFDGVGAGACRFRVEPGSVTAVQASVLPS